MRKLLLFGGEGQVGTEIRRRSGRYNWTVIAPSFSEVDITKTDETRRFITSTAPTVVVNAAAYTAVDKAEEEIEKAFAVNATGAFAIAQGCSDLGIPLIHFSTDYVYPGTGAAPLTEESPVGPINQYGRSKLEGEVLVSEAHAGLSTILRTSSVFGIGGHNFVKTMLRLFRERRELKVVSDQIMSPTWAGWDAEVVFRIIENKEGKPGVFNCSCAGSLSWYEFACAILEDSGVEHQDGGQTEIQPIPASQYSTPARRPSYSALDCSRLEQELGCSMMPWREGLAAFLTDMSEESS